VVSPAYSTSSTALGEESLDQIFRPLELIVSSVQAILTRVCKPKVYRCAGLSQHATLHSRLAEGRTRTDHVGFVGLAAMFSLRLVPEAFAVIVTDHPSGRYRIYER